MNAESRRRIAANKELFRAHNENIRDALEAFASDPGSRDEPGLHSFMCECAGPECDEMIELSLVEYRDVRASYSYYAIKPEHPMESGHRVVERSERFWVIESDHDAGKSSPSEAG